MDNNLFQVTQQCRREIYGYSYVIDKHKKEAFLENMRAYAIHNPDIPLDFVKTLEPFIDKLCSFSHVHIVPQSHFLTFEIDARDSGPYSTIIPKPHATHLTVVASFSGFVDMVNKERYDGKATKHYYIHSFQNGKIGAGEMKLVRYCTYTTDNKLIDGLPPKKAS